MMTVREGQIREAVTLSRAIPAFQASYPAATEYVQRFYGREHLILIAEVNNRPVGFKVGYDRYGDGSFYSWLGGVLPEYRRRGVALKLIQYQEVWAKNRGYRLIRVKTRRKFTAMRALLARCGYTCYALAERPEREESRYLFHKTL